MVNKLYVYFENIGIYIYNDLFFKLFSQPSFSLLCSFQSALSPLRFGIIVETNSSLKMRYAI